MKRKPEPFARASDVVAQLIVRRHGLSKDPVYHLDSWTPLPTWLAVVLDPLCGIGTTPGRLGPRPGQDRRRPALRLLARCLLVDLDPASAAKTQAHTWARRQGGLFDGLESAR